VVWEYGIDRITARRGSFWGMPAARERHYLTGVSICPSPGLMRSTRCCGKTVGFPTRPPAETKHELAAQLVEKVQASERIKARWVVCDEGYGDSPAFLERLAGAGLWYLAEVPRDTKVWPLLETDGQTQRRRPSSWVPPQTRSRKGPLVADFLVLRAVLPLDRLPGPEVWVVIRRKVSGEASEPEWKF
jgi:hypothetical protein